MLQVLDITKPVKEIIIDKFNAKSGLSIAYDHVVLGDITVLTDPAIQDNTSIKIVPTLLAPHLNTFTLTYSRMSVVDILSVPYLLIPSNGFTTLYALLDDLNLVLGLNLTTDDVEDAPIVVNAGTTVVFKTKPTSILFEGEAVLSLDIQLNAPTTSIESSSTLFVANSVSTGLDFLSAHSFDGFKSKSFVFLRNVDLVSSCKIDKVFSTEGTLLVLTGSFQFVATRLAFISSVKTYKTLTLHRDGSLVSAREEESLLNQVDNKDISIDTENKLYYVVDTLHSMGGTKYAYRLFENGTLDSSFNSSLLDDNIVKLVCVKNGFYTISKEGSNIFNVKRYFPDSTIDPDFSEVMVECNASSKMVDANYTFDEFGEEILHVYLKNNYSNVQSAPTYIAANVVTETSSDVSEFYSPIFSIHDKGQTVRASGLLASYNSRLPFNNNVVFGKLVKTQRNNVALYSLEKFGFLNFTVVTPVLFGEDKEYVPEFTPLDSLLNTAVISKILQISNGHETYVVVVYNDNNTNDQCSGIISFNADHKFNGLIMKNSTNLIDITDVAILR